MKFIRNHRAEQLLGGTDTEIYTCKTCGWGYTIVFNVTDNAWTGSALPLDAVDSRSKVFMGGSRDAVFGTRAEVERLCEDHRRTIR